MFDLSSSLIVNIERSINLDTFEKRSNKSRTSDSFNEIFEFFTESFNFISSLNFKPDEIKGNHLYFLSLDATTCSYCIDTLLSIAASQYKSYFNEPKKVFPSWCPDRSNLCNNK
ncbi:hypothetical protein M9Y10_032480 [Tritrichomonas musculus]|uniref:Uncharacterized protein n=1 Tax=Tritrichomonas musculus TaxID=1915356 RepID=A0ABR2H0I2_9EUKA